MNYTVLDRQSVFDIAIQQCGSASTAFAIAVLNGKNITDDVEVGEILRLPPVVNKNAAEYYVNNKLNPATGLTPDQAGFEGINYMGIEYDFIVD